MRKTLEDFYYGNIIPNEQDIAPRSEMKRATDRVARFETQLIESQQEIDSITALENFILGFRLGTKIMMECMDENDGDIRTGG